MTNSFKQLIRLAAVLALVPPAHAGTLVLSMYSAQAILEPNPAIIRVVTYDDVARTLKELEDQYAKVQQQFGNDPTKAPLLKAMDEQIQRLKETLRVSQEAEQQAAQKQQQEQSMASEQATKQEQVNQLNAKIEELRKQQAAQRAIEQQQKDAQEAAKQEQVKQLNAKIEELRKQQAAQQAAEQSAKDAQAQEAARQDELKKQQAAQQQEDQTSQQAVQDAKVRELTQKIEALRKLQAAQQAIEDRKKQAAEQAAKTSEQQQLDPNFGVANGQQSGVQLDTTTANSTPQTMPNQQVSSSKNLQDLKARLDALVNKKKSQGTAPSVTTAGTPANSAASNSQANLEILKRKITTLSPSSGQQNYDQLARQSYANFVRDNDFIYSDNTPQYLRWECATLVQTVDPNIGSTNTWKPIGRIGMDASFPKIGTPIATFLPEGSSGRYPGDTGVLYIRADGTTEYAHAGIFMGYSTGSDNKINGMYLYDQYRTLDKYGNPLKTKPAGVRFVYLKTFAQGAYYAGIGH